MNEPKICGQCQREIPDQAPFGICPVCVLNLATDENPAAKTESHPSSENIVAEPHQLTGKFPNLEIVSLLGRGGMGAVYLARQTSLDRIVALKVLSSSLAADPSFTERFIREAKTLAKLTHPNIVTVFDSGQAGDASYLVMEYVDGVNLRDAIATHEIDSSRALAIVQQVCDALQHAHDSGVIHRDIKPENILIDRNGHVKIADFGLAKLLQPKAEQYSLTGTRQVLGTRNYMAPEQIESPESVDHRADLYSLGVVLYELLTGELPIGRFGPPSDKSGCSEKLDELVMRSLAKDPGQRFQQASMIGSAVRDIESSIGPSVNRMPLVEAVTRTDQYANAAGFVNNTQADPVPFSISKVKSDYKPSLKNNVIYYLAKANGMVHLHDDRIEMEYRVSDPVVSKESELKSHSISLNDLAGVELRPTLWGGAKMRFRAMSLSAVEPIPKSTQGTFSLDVSHRDRNAAEQFADATNRLIVSRNPRRSSVVSTNHSEVTLEEIVLVDERLKVPRIGFYFCAVVNFVLGLLVTGLTILSIPNRELRDFLNTNILYNPAELFFFIGPGLLVLSIPPWIAAKSLQHHRNLHLLVIVLLLMLLPWISLPLMIQIPLSVWSLIVLSLPTTRKVFRNALLVDRMQKRPPQPQFNTKFNLIIGVCVGLPLVIGSLLMMTYLSFSREAAVEVAVPPSAMVDKIDISDFPETDVPIVVDVPTPFQPEAGFVEPATLELDRVRQQDVRPSKSTANRNWKPVRKTTTHSFASWVRGSIFVFVAMTASILLGMLTLLLIGMARHKANRK